MDEKEIPYGQCRCGCGMTTKISPRTKKSRNYVKGEPIPFIQGHENRGRPSKRKIPDSPERQLCACGCGNYTTLYTQTSNARNMIKGQPAKYLTGHGPKPFKPAIGYKRLDVSGYIRVYMPDHPAANSTNGTVAEHTLVMEQMLGRRLRPEEFCHHIDGNKQNNAPSNLLLLDSIAEHHRIHKVMRGWSRAHKSCIECGTTTTKHKAHGICANCYARNIRNNTKK